MGCKIELLTATVMVQLWFVGFKEGAMINEYVFLTWISSPLLTASHSWVIIRTLWIQISVQWFCIKAHDGQWWLFWSRQMYKVP